MEQPHEHYTHGHHESVLKSHTWRTIANSAAYLEPQLAAGLSLLDVGCGPGTITVEFADRLAPGRVVGLDAAAEVIAKASADFARPNLEFIVGS
ncbi:MAG TPA: class I SAM-dependent methyltransferase, partial [Rhodoglobus sp.]|nr:class I SAM-dependent methyltransferase [Rhodoglobus sp.]